MPPRAPIVTPFISNLITSKEYPTLPTADELQSVHSILSAKSAALALELQQAHEAEQAAASAAAASSSQTKKKDRDKDKEGGGNGGTKKRKLANEEGSEALALAANAASGAKLEALERQRAIDRLASGGKLASPGGVKVKRERMSASPAPSNASSVGPKPHHAPITYGQSQQMKKKKKNRIIDSDDERSRDRSTTLAGSPPHPHPQMTSGLKVKLPTQSKQRPVDPSPAPSTVASTSDRLDWSLPAPSSRPLVPSRPGVNKPLKPGPKRQAEVDEDFSNTKAPTQTAFTTFWSSVEPYLREIREDDLAMLAFKVDAPETYEIPPRGRHYTELWDEEDGQALGNTPRISVPNMRPPPTNQAQVHWAPSVDLKEEMLGEEWRGLGNVTERVVAAVMGDMESMKKRQEEVKGRVAEDGSREGARVDVAEFEERMKRELRSVMLLGEHEEFDALKREDDEITSALRQCQRQLLQQASVNDARKTRLAQAAKDRLAYAEYLTVLEGLEKSIETEWAKRVKKHGLTPKKNSSGQTSRPPVSENLKKLVATRQRWIDSVGQVMREKKGDCYGLPMKSIYEGISAGDDEEKDERSVEDAVEVQSGDEE